MQETERLTGDPEASLTVELQTFPHAVLYHQAAGPAGGHTVADSIRPSISGLVVLNDPEVSAVGLRV